MAWRLHHLQLLIYIRWSSSWIVKRIPFIHIEHFLLFLPVFKISYCTLQSYTLFPYKVLQPFCTSGVDSHFSLFSYDFGVFFETPSLKNCHGFVYVVLCLIMNRFIHCFVQFSVLHFQLQNICFQISNIMLFSFYN